MKKMIFVYIMIFTLIDYFLFNFKIPFMTVILFVSSFSLYNYSIIQVTRNINEKSSIYEDLIIIFGNIFLLLMLIYLHTFG